MYSAAEITGWNIIMFVSILASVKIVFVSQKNTPQKVLTIYSTCLYAYYFMKVKLCDIN